MRIAIEATAACRPVRTGIAVYTVRLIEALLDKVAPETGDTLRLGCRLSRFKHRRFRFQPPGVPSFWIQEPLWPIRPPADVLHGTDARVPACRGVARVATVHDLGPLLFSEFSSPAFTRKLWQAYARLAARCHRIVADSQATRQDFLDRFDFPAERLDVVHLGVSPAFRPHAPLELQALRARHRLPQNYLLYVGQISRRKNTANLLAAYAASPLRHDLPLVLAGAPTYRAAEELAALERLGIAGRVLTLGYLPEEDLPPLYGGAAAFLFPTSHEGFGLPILEAMASGVPVVAGNVGASPEVAAGHAVLVNPRDPADIAAGIERALTLPPAAREAARRHAAAFTWERCARATRAVYLRAMEQR
jgi:glycosyltransferase involved in cell wall biosynthesis